MTTVVITTFVIFRFHKLTAAANVVNYCNELSNWSETLLRYLARRCGSSQAELSQSEVVDSLLVSAKFFLLYKRLAFDYDSKMQQNTDILATPMTHVSSCDRHRYTWNSGCRRVMFSIGKRKVRSRHAAFSVIIRPFAFLDYREHTLHFNEHLSNNAKRQPWFEIRPK